MPKTCISIALVSVLEITCPELIVPINGLPLECTNPSGTQFYDGSTCRFSCETGYTLVGQSKLTCFGDGSTTNGEWDNLTPTCEGKPLTYKICYSLHG